MNSQGRKIALLGLGNAGNQVASLGEKLHPTIFEGIFVNASDNDLKEVIDSPLKFKIGDRSTVQGSGMDREKMKEYLDGDIQRLLENEKFITAIKDKNYCYIISSTAGGTGSGSAPVMIDILSASFPETVFILVGILPILNSTDRQCRNTKDYLQEIWGINQEDDEITMENNWSYMMYSNGIGDELDPMRQMREVNENIVRDLYVLSAMDNHRAVFDSIDPQDLKVILSTPGRIIVGSVRDTATEKHLDTNSVDDMLLSAIRKSKHVEMDRDRRIKRMAFITYLTEEANRILNPSLTKLIEYVGEPDNGGRFNHYSINHNDESQSFFHIILSGCSPILDYLEKINNRIEYCENVERKNNSGRIASLFTTNEQYEEEPVQRKQSDKPLNYSDILNKYKKKK